MIWLAWRQLRTQAVAVFTALAILAVVVIVTGLQMRHWYDTSGIAGCTAVGDCDTVTSAYTAHYSLLQALLDKILLLIFPAITGMFWGAPLIARELDTGTYRLAWTQSITRARWLTAKVAVVGTASVAASGLLSWMVTWWYTPIDMLRQGKFDGSTFSVRDVVPIGYAAFAFALGLTAGLLMRKTLPAMATTLVGYIVARIVVLVWIRPHFASPLYATALLQPPPAAPGATHVEVRVPASPQPGSWLVSSHLADATGHTVNGPIRITPGDPCVASHSCLAGYHQVSAYQPADRYWPFQWDETILFFAAALLLIAFCFWWITDHHLPTIRRGRAARSPDAPLPPHQGADDGKLTPSR